MSKKLTIEFIREEFAKEDYTLLTKEYKNAHSKLEYICPNGHRSDTIWYVFYCGKRCPYCAVNKKLDISYVRGKFKQRDYQLLSNVYINNRQRIWFICSEGHIDNITWHSFSMGRGCVNNGL